MFSIYFFKILGKSEPKYSYKDCSYQRKNVVFSKISPQITNTRLMDYVYAVVT